MNDKTAVEILRKTVRKYPLHEFLAFISCGLWAKNKVSQLLDSLFTDTAERKALWVYSPSLAKFAISNSNDSVGVTNRDIQEAINDLIKCISIINKVKDPVPNTQTADAKNELSKFMFHIAQQQFGLQETRLFIKNELARSIFLYDVLPKQLKRDLEIDVTAAIETVYGMSVLRFFSVLMLFMGGYNGGWRNSSVLDNLGNNMWNVTTTELSRFVGNLSIDYAGFRQQAADLGFSGISSQFYGYTPFDSHPITLRSNGDFLIISPHYLFKYVYLGVYFDLLKYYQESTDLRVNDFSREFGKIFEEYAWRQFSLVRDESEVIREFQYSRNKRFTDITLDYGNYLVLIECKKNRLRLEGRYITDESKLKEDLGKAIVRGLIQISRRIEDVKNADQGLEKFGHAKSFYPVICTFDDAYLLNDNYVRKMVDEQLAEEGISFQHPWQIIKISEVEEVITCLNEDYSFLDMLKDKLSSDETLGMDWQRFQHKKGISPAKNPILSEALNDLVKD